MSINLFNRGVGINKSPYKGLPRFQKHYGYNYGYQRMQLSCEVYLFGFMVWLVW